MCAGPLLRPRGARGCDSGTQNEKMSGMYEGPLDKIATNAGKSAGQQVANSPLVRACLESGRLLVEQELMGDVDEGHSYHSMMRKHSYRPLCTVTQETVATNAALIFEKARSDGRLACALFGTPPDWAKAEKTPSVGGMKHPWPTFALFLGDLARYALHERYSLTAGMLDQATRTALHDAPSFSKVVEKVAYRDMAVVYADETSARFQHLANALTDFHGQIREALSGIYEHSFRYWREVYSELLDARGASLRPGISIDDLTIILNAIAQGLSLRHIGATDGKVINHRDRSSVLGKAALLVIAGAVDPGDGRPVADLADELMAVRATGD